VWRDYATISLRSLIKIKSYGFIETIGLSGKACRSLSYDVPTGLGKKHARRKRQPTSHARVAEKGRRSQSRR
jgi:hypothetical protein